MPFYFFFLLFSFCGRYVKPLLTKEVDRRLRRSGTVKSGTRFVPCTYTHISPLFLIGRNRGVFLGGGGGFLKRGKKKGFGVAGHVWPKLSGYERTSVLVGQGKPSTRFPILTASTFYLRLFLHVLTIVTTV